MKWKRKEKCEIIKKKKRKGRGERRKGRKVGDRKEWENHFLLHLLTGHMTGAKY